MSLSYEKIVARDKSTDSVWAAYSDLFTMLSAIFLMLFVTVSLRSGTDGIKQRLDYQKLQAETEDLKEQNRVYNTLKDSYLEAQATKDEQKVYQELMDKLSLLKGEAKTEKEQLRFQAAENEKKEVALNQYQQIVRNIINANMLAKAGLKYRDEVIETKRQTIQEDQKNLTAKSQEISRLSHVIDEKESLVAANTKEIANIQDALSRKIAEARAAQEKEKISKADMDQKITVLQLQSKAQVDALLNQNQDTTKLLDDAKARLADATTTIDRQTAERGKLIAELGKTKNAFQAEITGLQSKYNEDMTARKKAFEGQLTAQKLSGEERANQERAFAAKAQAEAGELKDKLAALGGKMNEAEGRLLGAEDAQKKYLAYIGNLQKEKEALNNDLQKSQNILKAKRDLADKIKASFEKAGVKAAVDPKTGDVTLAFGGDYFETGKADVKPGMVNSLKKFIPTYAETLLKDPESAANISSVEIVGFASPTYKGVLVDPESLNIEDQAAVNYNLDLSYNRAKSIFTYIFDTRKMRYNYQKKLLPLVKVTGRSYLSEDIKGRDLSKGLTLDEFCKQSDCQKAQKVIIRFNLKD